MTTNFDELPAHVIDQMQKIADLTGASIKFVDPSPFLGMPAPTDQSKMAQDQAAHAAYQEAVREKLVKHEEQELKRLAADLPSDDELRRQSAAFGVPFAILKEQAIARQTEAADQLTQRKAEFDAQRQAEATRQQEARLQQAIDGHSLYELVRIGEDKSFPTWEAARAEVEKSIPGFITWKD